MDKTAKEMNSESADEIRSGIENTRDELSETIQALQDKLSPDRIKENAKAAAIHRAENIAQCAGEKAAEIKDQIAAAPTVKDKGWVLVNAMKQNPIPAAALGLGVLWLGLKILRRSNAATKQRSN